MATATTTTNLTFEQRIAQLKSKVATTSWEHTAFKSGAFAGSFVGVKQSGKFYIGVTATVLKGGNKQTRFANLNIDPEATGLLASDFDNQMDSAKLKSIIEMLYGPKAKIIVVESLTPQYSTHTQALDKDNNEVFRNGMPLYVQTQIADANASDVLVNANSVQSTALAEDTF
jgi:hypothetical protein